MKLKFAFIAVLVSVFAQVQAAGEKFQITAVFSPSFETYNDRKQPDIFNYKLSYNVGVNYKHFLAPDFSVSTGILFQNKGFSTRPVYVNSTAGTEGNIHISARYLSVPINLEGHLKISEKLDFVMSAGFTGGYLVSESFIGRRINGEEEIKEGVFYTDSEDRQPLDIFNDIYFGLNLGAGFCKYIKSKMVLVIEPTYRRQLNGAIDVNSAAVGYIEPRLDSWCIDFKIGYYFNKNIRNFRKTF